jgi:hypothetical protein
MLLMLLYVNYVQGRKMQAARKGSAMTMNIDSLVLGTTNAPYSLKLTADDIVACINEPVKSKSMAGPMSSFFYDVKMDLQLEFASAHNIPYVQLAAAAMFFSNSAGLEWATQSA